MVSKILNFHFRRFALNKRQFLSTSNCCPRGWRVVRAFLSLTDYYNKYYCFRPTKTSAAACVSCIALATCLLWKFDPSAVQEYNWLEKKWGYLIGWHILTEQQVAERGKMFFVLVDMFLLFVSKIGIMSRTVEQYFCLVEAAYIINCAFLYFFPRSVFPDNETDHGYPTHNWNKCMIVSLCDHATSYEIYEICFFVYLLTDFAGTFNSGKRCDSTYFYISKVLFIYLLFTSRQKCSNPTSQSDGNIFNRKN